MTVNLMEQMAQVTDEELDAYEASIHESRARIRALGYPPHFADCVGSEGLKILKLIRIMRTTWI